MSINDINSVLKFLYSHINYENKDKIPYKDKFGYDFILSFLRRIDFKYKKFEIIHIAGTNGKGSVATILSKLINSKKAIAGAFLSPHIISVQERILIKDKPIDNDLFIKAVNIFIETSRYFQYKPSFFEVITLIALIAFDLAKCKYIILETGLGGRLDSTNFADNKLAIINTIDYDHMETLGYTIEEIAREKADIIKNNNTVLIGKQRKSLYSLLIEQAIKNNADIYCYGNDFFISNLIYNMDSISFNMHSKENIFKITAPLLSIHQSLNISLAIEATKILNIRLTEDEINHALVSLNLLGRFQYINGLCHTILDGAHNIHSIKSLIVNLRIRFAKSTSKWLIVSINASKDYVSIINLLGGFFDYIVVCPLPVQIKRDISGDIFSYFSKVHKNVLYKNDLRSAYKHISTLIKKNDLLVITGSFYLIGEALEIVKA